MSTFRRRPPREDLFRLVVSARFLSTDEGGRKGPIASDYRPNCWFGEHVAGNRVYHDVVFYLHEGGDAVDDRGNLWVPPGGFCRADAFPLHASYLRADRAAWPDVDVCEGPLVVAKATIEDIVDPPLQRDLLLFDSPRRFQLWQAGSAIAICCFEVRRTTRRILAPKCCSSRSRA